MTRFSRPLTALFALFAGTLGGFFFAFTNPTMMGFANMAPETYVDAMNQINFAVRNPYFFALFFLTPVLGILAALLTRLDIWIVVAAIGSLLAFFITMGVNVPMNTAMEAWGPGTYPPATEIAQYRLDWMFYNTLRAALTMAATACVLIYLTISPQPQTRPNPEYPLGQPSHP